MSIYCINILHTSLFPVSVYNSIIIDGVYSMYRLRLADLKNVSCIFSQASVAAGNGTTPTIPTDATTCTSTVVATNVVVNTGCRKPK
jgi:hypothetical protein